MRKFLSLCLSIALVALMVVSFNASIVAAAVAGPSVQLDFTAMDVTGATRGQISAAMLGAVDVSDNYQIGLQGIPQEKMFYTVDGYAVSWITWKLTAPAGKQFTDADLQIVGKICDYAPNANLFGVFVYDAQPVGSELGGKSAEAVHFENAYDGTMPTTGSYDDVHDIDLSAKAAGKTEIYVTVMQMTTGSPEWIGYRSLSLTTAVEDIPKQALVVSPDGLSLQLDFTAMDVTGATHGQISAAMLGAVDVSDNYQIGLQYNTPETQEKTFYTVDGYAVSWITWKLTAPAGKQFTDADLQIVGKICDYAPNANLFGVFVYDAQPVGSELGGKSAEAVHFENAYDGTMPTTGSYDDVHDFDLSAKAAGKTVIYVTVMQMTTGSPEWIGYRGLSLTAAVSDAVSPTAAPTETPTPTPSDNPQTGDPFSVAGLVLTLGSFGALVFTRKTR